MCISVIHHIFFPQENKRTNFRKTYSFPEQSDHGEAEKELFKVFQCAIFKESIKLLKSGNTLIFV